MPYNHLPLSEVFNLIHQALFDGENLGGFKLEDLSYDELSWVDRSRIESELMCSESELDFLLDKGKPTFVRFDTPLDTKYFKGNIHKILVLSNYSQAVLIGFKDESQLLSEERSIRDLNCTEYRFDYGINKDGTYFLDIPE